MKALLVFTLGLALFLAGAEAPFLRAENWTTTDGKVYQNVIVVKTEADAVTILHQDGGALVPLIKLSPELRTRFNYDPQKAEAAALARVLTESENAKALQAEIEQTRLMKQMRLQAEDPRFMYRYASTPTSGTSSDVDADAESTASSPRPDPNRHSTAELISSAQNMRLDPSTPGHYTTSHLLLMSQDLSGDSSGAKHHSTTELLNSGL